MHNVWNRPILLRPLFYFIFNGERLNCYINCDQIIILISLRSSNENIHFCFSFMVADIPLEWVSHCNPVPLCIITKQLKQPCQCNTSQHTERQGYQSTCEKWHSRFATYSSHSWLHTSLQKPIPEFELFHWQHLKTFTWLFHDAKCIFHDFMAPYVCRMLHSLLVGLNMIC